MKAGTFGMEERRAKLIQNQSPQKIKGIDAAVYSAKYNALYHFKSGEYTKFNDGQAQNRVAGYPKPIKGNWDVPPGWDTGINAALYSKAYNAIYFFKGSQYIKFTDGNAGKMVEGYPKPIFGNWDIPKEWAHGIDAAVFSAKYNAVYFFKDSLYGKFTDGNAGKMLSGYPKPIFGNWDIPINWAGSINAAVYSKVYNAMYLFKDLHYTKFKDGNAQKAVAGYPLTIERNWDVTGLNVPKIIITDVQVGRIKRDASVYSAKYNSMYLFKSGKYTKFNDGQAQKRVAGYPKPIKSNWDVPQGWDTGIDAAVYSKAYNAICLFKGNEYIKFADGNAGKMVEGYPKQIYGNWDIPQQWGGRIDAAVYSKAYNAIYFFRGNQYTKFNDGNAVKQVSGYPKPIKGNWDIPQEWASGIGSAVYSQKYNAIYLFRESEYTKFKDGNAQKAAGGYPLLIEGNWDI